MDNDTFCITNNAPVYRTLSIANGHYIIFNHYRTPSDAAILPSSTSMSALAVRCVGVS